MAELQELNPKRRPAEDEEEDEAPVHIANFDDLLCLIGPFGKWQIFCLILIFWVQVQVGVVNFLIVFMQFVPEYSCASENGTFVPPIGNASGCLQASQNDSLESDDGTPCLSFAYDDSILSRTIVTDWDLVCGREFLIATAQMVHMVGMLVGSCLAGLISDKIGRKPSFFLCIFLNFVFVTLQGVAPDYTSFLVFRFCLAVSLIGCMMIPFVYMQEITISLYRPWLAATFFIPYAFGYILLSPLAYWFRDWRWICAVSSAAIFPVLIFWFWWYESPRWLLGKNQPERAKELLSGPITRWNGSKLPFGLDWDSAIEQALEKDSRSARQGEVSFFAIFKYPKLIVRAVIIIGLWTANNFVYYGVTLNVTSLGGDIFVNNAIAGATEIPSYLLCIPLLKWGRKPSEFALLIFAGVCLLPVPWINHDVGRLVVAMAGKLAITASFQVMYVWTSELYPTVIRNSGLGFSSMASRVGGMIAPYIAGIALIDKSLSFLPMLIYGGISLGSAFLALFLPESKGQPLPERLEHSHSKHKRKQSIYLPRS